ncbi:MAG: class I SAM-dependent methyltransferase [Patescibacteria group bacterium]
MIYERGNAAKQWIFEELDRKFGQSSVRVLDLACGDAKKWKSYIAAHSSTRVIGIDTDANAIERGKSLFAGVSQIELRVFDAQNFIKIATSQLPPRNDREELFDAVVAMSAIEHVVDRPAFLKTTWDALRSGGIAYLNYDAGHFRSHDIKERLMVPISQMLAVFGFEGPYMKKVDDGAFRTQAEALGFKVTGMKKYNAQKLKGLMRGAPDDILNDWFAFEDSLNARFTPEKLDDYMLSTTLILEKP